MSKIKTTMSPANVAYSSWGNETGGPIMPNTPFTITDTSGVFQANSIIIFFQLATAPVITIQSISPVPGSITVISSQPLPPGANLYYAVINPSA